MSGAAQSPAVVGGRGSRQLLKGAIKIADIVKPAEGGNLGYFFVRPGQQLAAFYNAKPVQIRKRSVAGVVPKAMTEVAFAEAGFFGQLLQSQGLRKMLLQEVQTFLNLLVKGMLGGIKAQSGKTEVIKLLPAQKQAADEGEFIAGQLGSLQGKDMGQQRKKPGVFRLVPGDRIDAVDSPKLQRRKIGLTVGRKALLQQVQIEHHRPVAAGGAGWICGAVDQPRGNKDSFSGPQREGMAFHLEVHRSLLQVEELCLGMTMQIEGAGLSRVYHGAVKGKGPGRGAVYHGLQGQGILRKLFFRHGINLPGSGSDASLCLS